MNDLLDTESSLSRLYVGTDVGSSSARVGAMDDAGNIATVAHRPITYIIDKENNRFVTQSSEEVWSAVRQCLDDVANQCNSSGVIVSICVSATCSVVVLKRYGEELVPYNAGRSQDHNQNVIFWMDTRAASETAIINNVLGDDPIKTYMGGSFVEEMAIVKVKYMVDHIPPEDLNSMVFFDMNDYIAYKLTVHLQCNPLGNVRMTSADFPVGLDGEVKGWTKSFLEAVGLKQLTIDNFKSIGSVYRNTDPSMSELPLAGTPIANSKDLTIVKGVIDSYGSWIGSCGKDIKNSLTLVAGTSTCFMIPHNMKTPIKGMWGPFVGIFEDLFVSTGGHATTGKLIEHLFETHPAYTELQSLGSSVFDSLEILISSMERSTGKSSHFFTKHMFLYGELSGNRTPYGDASMRGVFFGESTDISLNDLVCKYVCVLEFLAFQTKQTIEISRGFDIKRIVICGSQAKNTRFVKLLAQITGLPVEVSTSDPHLTGVRGAAYLAYSGANSISLLKTVTKFNNEGITYLPETDPKLEQLLQTKYNIIMDIAERQIEYRNRMDCIYVG